MSVTGAVGMGSMAGLPTQAAAAAAAAGGAAPSATAATAGLLRLGIHLHSRSDVRRLVELLVARLEAACEFAFCCHTRERVADLLRLRAIFRHPHGTSSLHSFDKVTRHPLLYRTRPGTDAATASEEAVLLRDANRAMAERLGELESEVAGGGAAAQVR